MKIQPNNNLPLYKAIIATVLLHFLTLAGCCEDMKDKKQQEAKTMDHGIIFSWPIVYYWKMYGF